MRSVSAVGRTWRSERVVEHVVERQQAAQRNLGRGRAPMADVLGAEHAIEPPRRFDRGDQIC